jgi:hypothetical protein
MSAPSARDDVVAALYTDKRLRKLRFLMTDNTLADNATHPASGIKEAIFGSDVKESRATKRE